MTIFRKNKPLQREITVLLKGFQICERVSISASGLDQRSKSVSGYGPGGPGAQIRGGPNPP